MSCRKQRSAFDQLSEFNRGRIVAYRDCGLSFREIGSRVGRNQTTVLRICDHWIQEVSASTIRRRLQQSGLPTRRPLLGLTLTQNHRHLHRQWCTERRKWAAESNEVVFTDESRICLQHHDGRIRDCRHHRERMIKSCVVHTDPSPGIMGLVTAIFQQDNARPHVARIVQMFFVNHQVELLPWPSRSPDLSPIENMCSMVAQQLTQITPQLPHQINFGKLWKLLGLLYPKNTSKVSLNQCRGVWQR
ncbi:transposable element Tcb1 transposase [Trichonephila clavipes]|nr:transposable element Tcb1 transposase [Trichonephila clavipes]